MDKDSHRVNFESPRQLYLIYFYIHLHIFQQLPLVTNSSNGGDETAYKTENIVKHAAFFIINSSSQTANSLLMTRIEYCWKRTLELGTLNSELKIYLLPSSCHWRRYLHCYQAVEGVY